MARVLVLGGGFGGLAAAHELRSLLDDEHTVTVVARDEHFFMGFAKLWDLGDSRPIDEGTRPLTALANHGIEFVHTDITAIDPVTRTVATTVGDVTGDAIVVALGAGDDPGHRAALVGPTALNLYDHHALPAMKAAIDATSSGRIVIGVIGAPFKCPPAPFEAAFVVDERLRRNGVRDAVEVAVAHPAPMTLAVAGREASDFVAGALEERGIALHLEHGYASIDSAASTVTFTNGEVLDHSLFLGVPRNVPPVVVAGSPLAGNGGWIHPDPGTLRTAFDRVYAIGDATSIATDAKPLPKAGVFAAGAGVVAARNVVADLGLGDATTFDGQGFCYLELWDRQVAYVRGNFFAEGGPAVELTAPSREAYEEKVAYERDRLERWLG